MCIRDRSNWSATGRLVYDIAEFSDVEDILGFEIADLGGIAELESSNIADISVARKGSRLLVIDDEIVSYSTLAQLPNGHWYVKGVMRGVFDTVPRKHFAQTNVFFIRSSYYANVTTGGPVCREGNIVTEQYNITTSTVDHDEEMDYTKTKQLTTTRRAELPSVPAVSYTHLDVYKRQEMNKRLHKLKVQYKQSGQWLLYSKHQKSGYTHSETIDIEHKDGRKDVAMHTKWTQKGRLFIYNLMKKQGILPLIERKEGVAQ